MNDIQYWREYYKNNPNPFNPSAFAIKAIEHIQKHKGMDFPSLRMIELGCGNGRDSVWFAKQKLQVDAIDQVEDELVFLENKYSPKYPNLHFIIDDFTNINPPQEPVYDIVYSRFTWHSINSFQEDRTMLWISQALKPGGLILLEARSIKDSLYHDGRQISDTESITDHYRRFINAQKLLPKLWNIKLRVVYMTEQTGLAVHGDEDPVIIQIVALKDT